MLRASSLAETPATRHNRSMCLKRKPDNSLLLTTLLADFNDRSAEIKQRTDHEQRSYLTYFTSLVTVLLAIAAADKFGSQLSSVFQGYLPVLTLGLAVFLLWLPLDAINEQLRIRIAAVYIYRQLRPAILSALYADEATPDLLAWEKFQSGKTFRLGVASPFVSIMLVFRAAVGYAPSVVVFLYYLRGSDPFQTPGLVWLEICLLLIWGIAAVVPLVLTLLLATQKRYRTGD